MSTDTNTESYDSAPAVGPRVDRGVGRQAPKRDLVDRLRQVHLVMSWGAAEDLLREAADEVERLRLALLTADRGIAEAARAERLYREAEALIVGEWTAMLYAPRDGTKVELLIEHRTWWTAHKCSPDESRMWRATCEGQWIDHNGGGWTWAGMSGTPIGWRPLKTPNAKLTGQGGA